MTSDFQKITAKHSGPHKVAHSGLN